MMLVKQHQTIKRERVLYPRMSFFALTSCLFFFFTTSIDALPEDSLAKLYITAQSANINRQTGIGVYEGDVSVTRGSTHLTAAKLTTYTDKQDKMIKAVAEGTAENRAIYTTLLQTDKPILIAKAEVITYLPPTHYIIMDGNAEVSQGKDFIQSPHLEYDLIKQILLTKNDTNMKKNRTTIVIQPGDFTSSNASKGKE